MIVMLIDDLMLLCVDISASGQLTVTLKQTRKTAFANKPYSNPLIQSINIVNLSLEIVHETIQIPKS